MFPLQTYTLTANLSYSHRPVDLFYHGKPPVLPIEIRLLTHIRFLVTRTLVERSSPSSPESAWI